MGLHPLNSLELVLICFKKGHYSFFVWLAYQQDFKQTLGCWSERKKEDSHLPHFHQSSPIFFDMVQVIKMSVHQMITYHHCYLRTRFENSTDLITWLVTWMLLQIRGMRILTSRLEDNLNMEWTVRRSTIIEYHFQVLNIAQSPNYF